MADFPYSNMLQASGPSLAHCLPKREAAMGSCFHFELVVRLLAQKHFAGESVTRDVADGRKGTGLHASDGTFDHAGAFRVRADQIEAGELEASSLDSVSFAA